MNTIDTDSQPMKEPVLPRSHRLIRHLALLYGALTLVVALALAAGWLPASVAPQLRALAREAIAGGLGAITLTALLLADLALLGTLALTATRVRHAAQGEEEIASSRHPFAFRDHPGNAARMGQALIATPGAVLVWAVIVGLWPSGSGTLEQPAAANIAAAFGIAIAFVSLVAERIVNAFPAPQLPEAPALRRVLLLGTCLIAAAACVGFGRGAGLAWLFWPAAVIVCIPGLVAAELALRALGRLFLPAPAAADARAVVDSLVAGLLTGGPRAPATLLRTHLGLDFARSWALAFLSAAILPALLATALLCWGLSGLKLIELGHRGVYERFGAPVAVLGPGLHVLLPWPLGRLRPVEYGTIHSVPIGVDQSGPESSAAIGAEEVPPVSLNRLWESAHADQAHYLVPSAGSGAQSFQAVATEIYVLYRVGLTDDAAEKSIYTVANPESLIKAAAGSLVLRYFNSRTLDEVIGARRENVSAMLQAQLAAEPAVRQAGIEIVSVLIEEIHPPAGAASAYHAVQAAEVNANASISNERGRAKRVAGVAQQEAHQLIAAANARAAELTHAADGDAYRFSADRRAYADGRQAFLLERRLDALEAALARTSLTLIDDRLSSDQRPILDLRSTGAAEGAGIGGIGPGAAGASGGTSNNGLSGGNISIGGLSSGAEPPIVPEVEPER
jgi:regulator of protease activity HflC (stomatin/prohibitin superfamily)